MEKKYIEKLKSRLSEEENKKANFDKFRMLLFYGFFNPKNIRKTFKKNMILLNNMVFNLYMLLGSKITLRSQKEL